MNQSKIFLSIAILIAVGVVFFLINYSKQPLSKSQPTKLPLNISKEEKISLPKETEKLEPARKARIEKMVEIKEIRDEIKTKARGEIIEYQEDSFYSGNDFAVILKNQDEFKAQLIKKFKNIIIGVTAENCKVNLNKPEKSAILRCDIEGARYSTNSYSMHFLLNGTKRFGFDLYGFKEVGKKFIYEGKINGIPTYVVFEFPYRISHCHEHVWPR